MRAAFGLLLANLLAPLAHGADRLDGMDEYIRAAMKEWRVPGLAVAIVKDGQVITARGYGLKRLGTLNRVTKDTVFPIASCTKSFTAASLAMLADEKKLKWDDPIQKFLPSFRVKDPVVSRKVTIADLACHRTGWVGGHLLFVKGDLSHDEIIHNMRHLAQAKPFRTAHTYNNVAYLVLGDVIKQASGETWSQTVQRRLLQPLGMNSTYISYRDVPAGRLSARHRHYNEGIAPMKTPSTDDLVPPAGGLNSSVVDMAKWLQFQLNVGKHGDKQLIRADSVRRMHAQQHAVPILRKPDDNEWKPNFFGAGFGWFVRDYRGRRVVEHGGGWGAEMAMVPEKGLGVVVLSNLDRNGLVWMLQRDLMDAYLLEPGDAWQRGKKWNFWKKRGGPGHNFRFRDEEKVRLSRHRDQSNRPSQPLKRFAGRYESPLYGSFDIHVKDGNLHVKYGVYRAQLTHWQGDEFYGRAVVEPFLDWLVKFQLADDLAGDALEIISVGWKNPDEKHLYRRVKTPR